TSYAPGRAKDSFDGLCRPATAGLHLSCAALAAMALPAAPPAFLRGEPTGAQFCALVPRFWHCTLRHATNSDRVGDLGRISTYRSVELAFRSGLGCWHRDVSTDGLRLLVVALGQPHGAAILAVS